MVHRDYYEIDIGQVDLTSPHKACENYISHVNDALSCFLKVGEQYGKPTFSLPFGACRKSMGLALD